MWSLAIAAAAGVVTVFVESRFVMLRITATGFATSIAALLALGMTKLIDRESTRPAGVFGVAAVVVEFLLVLGIFWIEPLLAWPVKEAWAATAGIVALVGAFALGLLAMLGWPAGRRAAWTGLFLAALTFLLLEAAAWLPALPVGSSWRVQNRLWETAWAFGCFSVLIAVPLVGFAAGDRRFWRWIGVAAAVGGGTTVIAGIWTSARVELAADFAVCSTTLACVVAYANLVLLAPLKPGQRWVRRGAIAVAAATAACADLFQLWQPSDLEIAVRGMAAGGIVTACASIALIVLAALNRRTVARYAPGGDVVMTIVCPRCAKKQDVRPGPSSCIKCGLRFRLDVEEPRCPECEYLLYGIVAERCPECGAALLAAPPAEQPVA